MNVFKFLYSRQSIKRKVIEIKEDIKRLVVMECDEKFFIDSYGAIDINPKHLVIWICVQSDREKIKMIENSSLMIKLRKVLFEHNYPHEAIPFVHIGFESQETVDRESNGNWYHHFK